MEKSKNDVGPTHYDPWVRQIVSENVTPVPNRHCDDVDGSYKAKWQDVKLAPVNSAAQIGDLPAGEVNEVRHPSEGNPISEGVWNASSSGGEPYADKHTSLGPSLVQTPYGADKPKINHIASKADDGAPIGSYVHDVATRAGEPYAELHNSGAPPHGYKATMTPPGWPASLS